MLNTFLNLAAVAGEIGTVTAAALYPSGLISIELIAEDGTPHSLTYHQTTKVDQDEKDTDS